MSSKTGVIDSQLDLLSDCLEDFCTKHNLEFMSADDILYGSSDNELSNYQKDWLRNYISIWDTIANLWGLTMLETFTEFADYVWEFYSPKSDLYPIKGLTIEDVFQAIFTYKQRLLKVSYNNPEYVAAYGNNYSWGYGDSLDRERVRAIIFEQPQFSWSS